MKNLNIDYPDFETLNASNCRESSIRIHYPEFYNYLYDKYTNVSFPERIYLFYHDQDNPGTCKMCGNKTEFIGFRKGYREFCSYKCMNSCKEIQERKKNTCQKNYGTNNPMNSPEIREKIKQTCLEKYGVENCFQSSELMEKSKNTCKKKYGTEYANQSQLIKDKILESKRQKILNRHNNILEIIHDESDIHADLYIMGCPDSNCNLCSEKKFEIRSNILYDRSRLQVDLCTIRTPVGSHIKNTGLEKFVQDILNEHEIQYITNDRRILDGKELDIYIPDRKIAIECNGVYWHSKLDTFYHYNKWYKCKENGIQLLSVWEDWVTNKPDIIKSIILSKLNIYDKYIGARECDVKIVESGDARKFLNENHIQGFCNSTLRYGLYYNRELVALMCFKKSSNPSSKNNTGWELLRFCTKTGWHISGAASRLLSHFRKDHNEIIVSFASHDISNGNLYEALGFQYKGEIKACYWYVHNQTHMRFHRSSFTKKELVRKGYDPNLTEEQIMMNTDYFRIYDSGQSKYVLV